mgnify:CR=1 FL=1
MIINDLLLFKRASKKEISFEDITKANLKVVKSLIDGRNYRASSELFYKATGFKAVKSVLQANKDFKKMFLKDKKFNFNNKIFNNFEIINDTKKK